MLSGFFMASDLQHCESIVAKEYPEMRKTGCSAKQG